MSSREQLLALLLIGGMLLVGGGALGYVFVWMPLQKAGEAELALQKDIDDLEKQVAAQRANAPRLATARKRSLPADEALARREYTLALERLLETSGVPKGYTITPKAIDNSSRAVPELSKGKPIYQRVAYEVSFKRADMWAIRDFLKGYYDLGLLHQITAITIKKDDEPGAAKGPPRRNDLAVTLTTEAIIVEGADNRRTLVPVPGAFAAVGGAAMQRAIAFNPEAGRAIVPQPLVPVLSTSGRDYSLMVLKDPFNGPLVPPPVVPFKIASLPDVQVVPDEAPKPVKVNLTGNGSTGAKVVAVASGSLFAEGALKVDPKTNAIELPKTSATEGTSTVSVVATSAEGVVQKASFKVSVKEVEVKRAPPKPAVDFAIILIGTTPRSDGTAWARIRDNANRLRYDIEAAPKGVVVTKDYTLVGDQWRKDRDYVHAPGLLVISDDTSSTSRTFKVIAVEADGIIVADLRPAGAAPAPSPRVGMKGPGGWPPKGPAGPPRQGHASPLAAVGGNVAAAILPPKLYRWPTGQALSAIKAIPDDEAKKILKQAADTGPVFDVVASGK